MDGRGRALDNVFIERLWWTVKYEDVYPKGYADGHELYKGLSKYFKYYSEERGHFALDKRTPAEVFDEGARLNMAVDLRRSAPPPAYGLPLRGRAPLHDEGCQRRPMPFRTRNQD